MPSECDICGDEHNNRRDNLCNSCRYEMYHNITAKWCNECGNRHYNRVAPYCNDCRRGLCDDCRCELSEEARIKHFTRCLECYIKRKNANRPPAVCLIGDDD
jgi:hypothetical protein